MKLLLMLVTAALAATSCNGAQSGTPRPEQSSQPSTAQVSATSSSVARPRSLDLHGVDPCRLLDTQQLASFNVDRPGRPGTAGGDSLLAGAPDCVFSSFAEQYGFIITSSTAIGLSEFLAKTRAGPSRKTITVAGYPAVEEEGQLSTPERGSGACFVDVDVADGQLLGVLFNQIAAQPEKRLPIETLCAKARQVAEAALTTLQGG